LKSSTSKRNSAATGIVATLAVLCLAGCGQQGVQAATAALKVDPLVVDFGDQPVLTPVTREIHLHSIGRATLTFGEAALVQPVGQKAFTVKSGLPLEKLSGAKEEVIVIAFSAPAMMAYSATLVLSSNDANEPNIAIPITGKGTTAATAVITPACLDFGPVCEGHSKIKAVTIGSSGSAPLLVNQLTLSDGSNAAFGPVGSWATDPPLQLAAHAQGMADDSRDVSVVFRPTSVTVDSTGMATGTLQIGTNDPLQQTVSVCLTGTMQKEPVANAGPNQIVAPGDTVMLDGSQSTDPGMMGLTYQWALVSRPQGSNAKLEPGTENTPMTSVTVDVPGAYVASLTVSDGVCASSVPSRVTITAASSHDMKVELVWDNSIVDLDLHVRQKTAGSQSPLYGANDCWWDHPNQVWGNGTGHHDGDVLSGFGPERVTYENAVAGDTSQLIATVVYSSANGAAKVNCSDSSATNCTPVTATVRVLMYGVVTAEIPHVLQHPGTFPSNMGETWDAVVIDWPSGQLSNP
jgi:hypothetical protein